jgi:YHS domain-containing protein
MKYSLLTAFVILMVSCSQKKPEIFTDSAQAIRGYDPVAYFTEEKPVKGNDQFSFKWKDATWYFASQQNLDSFTKDPEKYAPQYGGYCAYGCSRGKKAPVDPYAWTIVDGKLYLNNSLQVKEKWMQDEKGNIEQADINWPAIKDK